MRAARTTGWKTVVILAACSFIMIFFPGHLAIGKSKTLKDQLKHALVGQVVTSRVLLGNRARPGNVARQSPDIDFPVHTLVDADTGQIVYRVEDPLLLEWATVHPGEMLRSFEVGTSFRISSVHLKDNRIEIKLKHLGGQSAELKLIMGKGWQSRYNAAAVKADLSHVFAFSEPMQQLTVAQQARPQVEHDVPLSGETTSATPGAAVKGEPQRPNGASQGSMPVAPSEQPGPAIQPVMRPAYVDCDTLNHVSLFPSAEAPAPIAELPCGEKVTAMGEENGWVKVRTEKDVEGYVSHWFLAYGEPPLPDRPVEERPARPEGKADSPTSASAPGSDGIAKQVPPAQAPEKQPSAYVAPTGYGGSATGPSVLNGYWPLLIAASFGLLLVGLALSTDRRVENREKDEPRKGERRKEKREERMGNEAGKASASAKRSYGHVAARFADLAKACGPQIAEMARATMAVNGVDFSGKGPADFLFFDAVRILSIVSKTKERVPARLAGLCRAMHRRLNPRSFAVWDIDTILDNARSQSFEIDLPFSVTLLAGYDEMKGTHLAQRAADDYWVLVCAACEIMDSKSGVATKIVRDRYLQFFEPYLSTSGDGRAGSEGPSGPAAGPDNGTSGFGGCTECTKSYEALDIRPNATREEIKTAYRDLAKIFHSDRLQGAEERVQRKAEERLKEINLAYGHISSHWTSQEK